MSFLSGGSFRAGGSAARSGPGDRILHLEERRSVGARELHGTLACARCDAPIAPGPDPLQLSDPLACPFCGDVAPARDLLSLSTPGRPARVIVRVRVAP